MLENVAVLIRIAGLFAPVGAYRRKNLYVRNYLILNLVLSIGFLILRTFKYYSLLDFLLFRYIAASRATEYHSIVRRKRVYMAVAGVWTFAAINTAPILIGKYTVI